MGVGDWRVKVRYFLSLGSVEVGDVRSLFHCMTYDWVANNVRYDLRILKGGGDCT